MATSKTLAPTNVTISIPAMTDAPNASVISNCIDKEADAINALNSQFTLQYENLTKDGTVWSAGSITIRRRGCVVELKVEGATIGTTSGYSQISTVPNWAIPYSQIYFKDDSNTKAYHVEADGKLMVSSPSSGQNWGRVIYLAAN